jgi:hypothetical protein
VVASSFDMDKSIIFTTLHQPKASGDKHSLFQIKVQVKNQKVNSLFKIGSQCNLIYETLVDKLGLETYDPVKPSSLSWLQGEFFYENHLEM